MEQAAADANPPVAQIQPNGPAGGAVFALTDDLLAGRFFSIDVRGQVTGWNPRAESAFGWSTHHVSGMSLFDKLIVSGLGFGPDDLDAFYAAAGAGAGRRVRVLVNHMAGSQLPVELSIVPIQLAKAYELNAFLQDVSTSTASGVASEIGRVREEHAAVLNMITESLEMEPGAGGGEQARLAGALVVFHIDAGAMTMMPPGSSDGGSASPGGEVVTPAGPPVGTVDADVARAEAERVRAQIDEAHTAAEEARVEADVARRQRDELQAKLDAAESGSSESVAAAERAAEAERARAEEAASTAAGLRDEAEEARREAERLRGELEGLRAAADGSQASVAAQAAELGQARAELSQATADAERLGEQLAAAQGELAEARSERDALRSEIEDLKAKVDAAGETESALAETRSLAEKLEGELVAARTSVDEAQAAAAAAEQRAAEVEADATAAREGGEAAEAAVAAAREEVNAAREHAEAAQAELTESTERAGALGADLKQARVQAEFFEAQATEAGERAGALETELSEARAGTDGARAELETTKGELTAAQADLAKATERADAAAAETEAARAELKEAREQVAALRAELDGVRAEAESAGKSVGDAQKELGEAKSDAVRARAEAEKAGVAAEEARADAEQAKADADAARAEADEARAAAEAAEAAAQAEPQADPVFERVFDGAAIGMAIKHGGRFTRVNRALCDLTGREADDLVKIDPVELVHPDERKAHAATENELVAGKAASSSAEARLIHAAGDEVHVRESATVLDDGRLLLQFEPAAAEAHTAVEDHDPVTGLFNRRRFEEELSRHVAEAARHGDRGAALMLDLDENFSELDDAQGEQMLKTVADALKQNISEAEMLAHLGGDEFAVLLPHADAASARKIAANIVEAVGPQVVKVGDQSVRVTIDVGVALFDERDDSSAATEPPAPATEPAGDNLPVPVKAESGGASTALAPADGIVDRIRRALAEDLFAIYAQPIIDLRTSEITQYELLLRMKDDSGRLMLPDKFLPAAQQAGLMPAIDQWVVRQAIGLIHEAAQEGRRLLLEVNISADSIDDPALLELIEAELDATGVDPRMLVIEVTEDAALAKIAETIKLAKWIRSTGCRFALDDFGSTFATVKYLKDLPVDYFKLDGDLIVTLPESRTNQLLLNALMDVARGTGTQTIAVYVPDDETLVMLRQYGIGYGQGNRVGRPRPVAEI